VSLPEDVIVKKRTRELLELKDMERWIGKNSSNVY